ncbi:FkbM family methyltransferase [Tautonia sociabilis]|nr:FkbM family methyltransferase [Tautonia sociabilis]
MRGSPSAGVAAPRGNGPGGARPRRPVTSRVKSALRGVLPGPALGAIAELYIRNAHRASLASGADSPAPADEYWRARIDDVISCPDNAAIPRVPGSGTLDHGVLTMHNGLKVYGRSYYGPGNMGLVMANRGVHEPQEERVFAEVLRHVEPAGAMLELGAYWGFYSLWFHKEVPQARCFLVEPDPTYLACGRANFRLNGARADFTNALVGPKPAGGPVPVVTVDAFCDCKGIDRLAVLHADIQGAERDMLDGADRMLRSGRVDYVFISTHSAELHRDCLDRLRSLGFAILASADLHESYSVDGLIAARRPGLFRPDPVPISRKGIAPAEG